MTHKEIIEDEGFQQFTVDYIGDAYFNENLSIYEILHKTREAINKDSELLITVHPKCIEVENIYYEGDSHSYKKEWFYHKYNDSEIEALCQALYFIYKEGMK